MRKSLIAMMLMLLMGMPALALEPVKAESMITSVTVYPDRAMVTRTAVLKLDAGTYLIGFDNLPPAIMEETVTAEGLGIASAKITGLELKRAFLEQAPDEKVKKLEAEIQSLMDEVARTDSQIAVLSSQKAFLESIKVGYAERISKEMTVKRPETAELGEILRFLSENLSSLALKSKELEVKKRGLIAKTDALRRGLEHIKGEPVKEAVSVEIGVEVVKPGDLRLELSYVVAGAGWTPVYDMRLSPEGKKVEMTYRALVSQRTGEDWLDAGLSLSTARPSVGANPPEQTPWHVRLVSPPYLMEGKGLMGAKMPIDAFEPTKEEAALLLAEFAMVEEQKAAVLFRLPKKADIPSDGSPHSVTISTEGFAVKTEYVSIPKLSSLAYLKSEITNPTNYPFLPGKANVYMGADFTGASYIENTAPKEKLDLFFGIDEGIKVKREELKKHKEGGIIGKNRMTYRYKIELENFKKGPETITVLERLPLPEDEEIKVKLLESSPEPVEKTEQGIIKWVMTVNPGEKKEITFEFSVEYPKDRERTGL